MKYCPKCKEFRDASSALYCNICGEKLIESEQHEGCVTCPNCGTENQEDNEYCSKCGLSFNSEMTQINHSEERKSGKRGIIVLVILIVVLLGTLGFIGYKYIGILFPNLVRRQQNDTTTNMAVVATIDTIEATKETETQESETQADTAVIVVSETISDNNLTNTVDPTTGINMSLHTNQNPVIKTARTLSGTVLGSSNRDATRSFDADQAIDGIPETCWCVNTSENGGAGAEIMIILDNTALVTGIRMINGNTFLPEEDIYSSNGQVRDFTLEFSTGESKSYTATYNSNGASTYQTFQFDMPVETSYIIFHVDSGYVGASFQTNVCLGEFDVF